jgi:hypothetical protein
MFARRILPLMTVCAALTLLGVTGCEKKDTAKGPKDAAKDGGVDLIVLEYEEIDITPGSEKQVKVKSGKAEKAEAPADSGVTAKVDDGKVVVSAAKDAKEGTHEVAVKGGKKDATLKVHVKKAAG